ncbi:MAG: ComF family protein [Clostridia bacterium]
MEFISKIKQIILNTFYPKHIKCICCKNEIKQKNVYDLCENCQTNLPFIHANFCTRCGLQFEKDGKGICLNCKSTNFDFEVARSALNFDGTVVKTIHKFKYAKYKFLAEPLSYFLYDILLFQNWNIDLICYVPLFEKREKERGYNQSRELAINLSKLTGIEFNHDLVRIRDTSTQTKLTRKERQENVKDCFDIADKQKFKNLNILLIDDVFTTGSTTNEISKLLKKYNANKIYVLTVAHAGFKQRF